MVIVKKAVPMPAFQLGTACELADKLTAQGLLLPRADGTWRVKTREATEEGELAKTGDYVKLDSTGMPYPTEREWFEANHTRTEEGMYLQTAYPRKAWCSREPMCPEIRFLVEQGLLLWNPAKGFEAELWGARQTAGPDAVVVLNRVETDSQGRIQAVDFHFVAADEFTCTYEVLSME